MKPLKRYALNCRCPRTLVIKIDPQHPGRKAILHCAKVLREGGLVAFPTETVYGLAASLTKKNAIDELYRVKGRPRSKPFTVHISDPSMIRKMGCRISKVAAALMDKFWPGPLTLILKSKSGKKIGFRMPANRIAIDLLRKSAVPVVAPSANISGRRPPTTGRAVLKALDGKIDILLDAGRTKIGIESTVVDMTVTPPKVLREGAVAAKKLKI